MKKTCLISLLILCSFFTVNAQNGLQNILVERYYVSDANDTSVNAVGGVLPIGSVTYRIYVDMLPGYKFQAAYGVNTPGASHELKIATTTLFFNNEDRGATTPAFTKNQARNNTVMLDSWLSVGAACNGNFGIPKANDDGISNIVNLDGVLQNNDPSAGIPLTSQDGLISGSPESVTTIGITNEIAVFDAQNDGTNGPVFSTFNGSWASLNGSVGPDTTNKVLIAQITTNGIFSFELNIQLGTPSGGVENYVASNPVGNEILFPALNYNSALSATTLKASTTNFIAYPNPFEDNLTLRFMDVKNFDNGNLSILDLTGKVVFQKSISSYNSSEPISLSFLPKGLYLLLVKSGSVAFARKITKI